MYVLYCRIGPVILGTAESAMHLLGLLLFTSDAKLILQGYIQAHSQKILLGVLFEGNVDLLFQPTSPGALKELIWCMHIAHIHEGL